MQVSVYLWLLNHVQKPQLLISVECRKRNPGSTSVVALVEVICSSGAVGVYSRITSLVTSGFLFFYHLSVTLEVQIGNAALDSSLWLSNSLEKSGSMKR